MKSRLLKNDATLAEDFSPWWSMKKYQTRDIPAKEFSNEVIKMRHGSNSGWPGEQKDVEYWVELYNGFAVGFRHGRSATGIRRSKYAEFPVAKLR
jgi:hypothetical protein|tara:strand:+ start:1460 stop:1744 length:285 start_codon:yes stop_codon:yes gene_type:complete